MGKSSAKSSQGMSYTRKKYARGSPPSGVVKFTMGEPSEDYQFPLSFKGKQFIRAY